MATVTHYIRSYYNPDDREKLERETGQHGDSERGVDSEEAWKREASQIERRRPPPPRFVPATIAENEWAFGQASSLKLPKSSSNLLGDTVSGWYRSLTTTQPGTKKTTSTLDTHIPQKSISELGRRPKELRNKNNWFIMNAIQSEPSTSTSTPAPSLADILARDPPPLPSDGKFAPPVFLEIGPSNKGFGMLQRSGWNEGEPLGPDVIRRKLVEDILHDGDMISFKSSTPKGKGKSAVNIPLSRQETVEVKMEHFDDVSELRRVDVIDLTLSGSNSDESDADDDNVESRADTPQESTSTPKDHLATADDSAYARKALLTPITTVLKSDRLGIGLKAKTVGPYKASQKRVTHNAAALAAHVKSAEEARKRQKLFGRGHRGFERQRKREEESRQALLAQLKGPW